MGYIGVKDKLMERDPHYALRHSAAHIMAQAIRRLYPQVRLAIGPPIEGGFYYDMELPHKVTEEDFPRIEAEIEKIIAQDYPFERSEWSKTQAREYFGQRGEPYKLEIIDGIPGDTVSIYKDGDFTDLCEGPHVHSTGEVKAIKLLSVAGAYWRGDEHKAQLQRIYATAFPTRAELDEYLLRLEEAKRRDHRKLGKDLELFSFEDVAGPGVVFFHPKGALVRSLIEADLRQRHLDRGYQPVVTPHIFRTDMWQQSGHLENYKEHMFLFEDEDQALGLKPMNCPGHILIYRSKVRSYRELPMRLFEFGTVYRNEKSGVLHGLLRVRGFTQDDAHLFLRPDQLVDEVAQVIDFAFEVMAVFGFKDYEVELSTRPEKSIGSDEIWEKAEVALVEALKSRHLQYAVHAGEGAFYGPKIDLKIKDALGRSWQCGTIQCDFALPERFDLTYVGEDGARHRTIMVHRALLGSFERFFGMLLEHYAGALPVWLAPVQVVVIPINEGVAAYAQEVAERLRGAGVRVVIDGRKAERMQAKIRDAQVQKVPYMAIVGPREAEQRAVALRHRKEGDVGTLALDAFAERIVAEVEAKVV
jgi:threonyl-tRNA synthetase